MLLKQRYQLLTTLGQGGFGAVYQAEDTHFPNLPKRAVKEMLMPSSDPHEQQQAIDTFKQEAVLLAGLMHQNLPRIYEYFEEGGRWYLVMDHINGKTLEDCVQASPGGVLPLQQVLHIATQLCTVLDYLHSQQPPIIFRDLKPANVMITTDDHLYLIDFGIARLFKPGKTKDTLALGSPGYAAPEQYGKAQTTERADIYSLGAVLHHLLSGRDPSDEPFQFPPLDLSHYAPAGPALSTLIMQMIEMDKAKRPTSARVIKAALQRLSQQGGSIGGSETSRPTSLSNASAGKTAHVASQYTASSTPSRPSSSLSEKITLSFVKQFTHKGTKDKYSISPFTSIQDLAWSPDSRFLASSNFSGGTVIWSVVTGDQQLSLPNEYFSALAWSGDSRRIFAIDYKSVVIWNAQTGARIHALNVRPVLPTTDVRRVAPAALAVFPDETRVVVAGQRYVARHRYEDEQVKGGFVYVLDAITGQSLLTYRGHDGSSGFGEVRSVAYLPGSRNVISIGAQDGTIQIWDAFTGNTIVTYHSDAKTKIASYFVTAKPSSDGKYIASLAFSSATMHVWDTITGNTLSTVEDSMISPPFAWSPDGIYIATHYHEGDLLIWDVATGRGLLRNSQINNYRKSITCITWSPDGKYIALGDDQGTVEVWKVDEVDP
jgi:serine/threonine protein kinase